MQSVCKEFSAVNYELPLIVKKEILQKRTEIKLQRNGESSINVTHRSVEVDVPINRRAITVTILKTRVIERPEQAMVERSITPVAKAIITDVKEYSPLKTNNLLLTFFALLMGQAKWKGSKKPSSVAEWHQHINVNATAIMLADRISDNFDSPGSQSSESIRTIIEHAKRVSKNKLSVRN